MRRRRRRARIAARMSYAAVCKKLFGSLAIVLIILLILSRVLGLDEFAPLLGPWAFLMLALGVPIYNHANRLMLGFAFILSLAAFAIEPSPGTYLREALDNGAFLGSFFGALNLLRFASGTSPSVFRCGQALVTRPPGQRYLALTFGSMLFSVVLNFGSLILLGNMTRDANARLEEPDARIREIRERRMLTALLRGFNAALMTSPAAFSFAVVLSIVPGTDSAKAATANIRQRNHLLDDRLAARPAPISPPIDQISASEWRRFRRCHPVVRGNVRDFGIGRSRRSIDRVHADRGAGAGLAGGRGWLAVLATNGGAGARSRALSASVRRLMSTELGNACQEFWFVMYLGFISALLAAMIASHAPDGGILNIGPHPVLFIAMVFAAVIVAGGLGLNPLVSVSVLGSLLPAPEAVGLHRPFSP